ncbi:MAG TPA: hypothetical protein VGR35_04650 [Tepidisphaeraceae bacterium]|nr:hypothetical protein [Tepidisphaeraceae bacterium]
MQCRATGIECLESRRLLAAAGLPDATFAQQGVQFTDFYGNKQMDRLTNVLPMSDGRFVAAGYVISPWSDATSQTALARYHADGSLDRTYGENGSTGGQIGGLLSFVVANASMQPDGSVVLVGTAKVANLDLDRTETHAALVRYTAQGAFDAGFGQGGMVLLQDLALDVISPASSDHLVRQADGKLLVLARQKDPGAAFVGGDDPVVVVRVHVNGSLDTAFGADGISAIAGPPGQQPSGLVAHGDGKITALVRNMGPAPGDSASIIVQLNADGSHDTSFGGGDGIVPLPRALWNVDHFTLVPGGGYLLSTWASASSLDTRPAMEVAKLTADGAPDTTFGMDGIASHLFDDVSFAEGDLTIQADGKILVVGKNELVGPNRPQLPLLARLNGDGSLDTSFASQGIFKVSTRLPLSAAGVNVALASDGAILIGAVARLPTVWSGQTHYTGHYMLMRFHNPAAPIDAPVINIGAGTLTVRGTGGNDSIRLRTRGDRRIEVTVNDLVESVAAANVVTIHVTGGGGDDWIDARELGILKRDGFDFPVTIEGGDGNDIIAGSDGRDRIRGEFGNDRIDGGGGDDSLSGNANHDRVHGGTGNDVIFGAGGIDVLVGDADDDEIYAGDHNDLIYGSLGNDFLNGEGGNEKMFGEEGNDQLFGGAGHDTLDGGVGSDNLAGSAGNDLFLARDGLRDLVAGGREGFDRAEVDDELDDVTGIEELIG